MLNNRVIGHRYRVSALNNMSVYAWSANLLNRKRVLDLGCGRGDGMMIQSFFAKDIVGIDANGEELENAKRLPYFCPISFQTKDLNDQWPEGSFDIITAFEIIDHLSNPNLILSKSAEHSKMFIFSVSHNQPSFPRESDPYKHLKKHHQLFTNVESVDSLVKPYFKNRQILMERKGIFQARFNVPYRYVVICSN